MAVLTINVDDLPHYLKMGKEEYLDFKKINGWRKSEMNNPKLISRLKNIATFKGLLSTFAEEKVLDAKLEELGYVKVNKTIVKCTIKGFDFVSDLNKGVI